MRSILTLATALLLPVLAHASDTPETAMPDFAGMLALSDANEDGIVTREEFIAARATFFPRFDADNSGGLSDDEFVDAMSGAISSAFIARRVFNRVDADGDDSLSPEEWDAIPPRAFDNADQNDDGQITPDERD